MNKASNWASFGLAAVLWGIWACCYYGLPFVVRNRAYRRAIHIVFVSLAVAGVALHAKDYQEKKAAAWFKKYQEDLAKQHEQERRAKITMRLRGMYRDVNELLHVPIPPDAQETTFQEYLANCKRWFFVSSQWIEENMGVAARDKFLDTVGPQIIIPPGANNQRVVLRTILARIKDNLEDLMEQEHWAALP